MEFHSDAFIFFSIPIQMKCVPSVRSQGHFCQSFKCFFYQSSLNLGHPHDVLFCFNLFLITTVKIFYNFCLKLEENIFIFII